MMKHFPTKSFHLLTGLLVFMLAVIFNTGHASAVSPGVDYTIVLNGSTYEVYMRPDFTPAPGTLSFSAQLTIKVPHNAASPFVLAGLTDAVSGVSWACLPPGGSRINAPPEDPTSDYISCAPTFTSFTALMAGRTAGTPFKVFSFQNGGACTGRDHDHGQQRSLQRIPELGQHQS